MASKGRVTSISFLQCVIMWSFLYNILHAGFFVKIHMLDVT